LGNGRYFRPIYVELIMVRTRDLKAWDLVPRRLRELGNEHSWDPERIRIDTDRDDWTRLSADEKDMGLYIISLLVSGKRSVLNNLNALTNAMRLEDRLSDVNYLAQFQEEERRHLTALNRFLRIIGIEDVGSYSMKNEPYMKLFYGELPRVIWAFLNEPSHENQARLVTTHNLVIEGVLANTSYRGILDVLNRRSIMSGLAEMIRHMAGDDARHVAYGTYLVSRLITEHGDAVHDAFMGQIKKLAPLLMDLVTSFFSRYSPPYPFNVDPSTYLDHARELLETRIYIVEKLRGMEPTQVIKELGLLESL
jgi:ribonucleoside-diphosphate reductase beta chain